ncbi:hypothetical protein [Rhizobacter sp. P5_C2]
MALNRTLSAAAATLLLALPLASFAADQAPPQGGKPPAPPPEAIAACNGKAEGATASFAGRGGETITGTCQKIGDVLALRPAGGPPGGGQGGKPPAKKN